ncbi:hypothetical protein HanIR_Chr13g0642021 [Helianthus annuus]|nr:hypothetical protein HanIR_Chr13g0642021 [Helianthus annuus]
MNNKRFYNNASQRNGTINSFMHNKENFSPNTTFTPNIASTNAHVPNIICSPPTPLSQIWNDSVRYNRINESAERRKARRMYLNNKRLMNRSSGSNGTINNLSSSISHKENLSPSTTVAFNTALSIADLPSLNRCSTTPLSNISNVIVHNSQTDDSVERRKARMIYLKNKKLNNHSSQRNVTSINLNSSLVRNQDSSPNTTFTVNTPSSVSFVTNIKVSANLGNDASSNGVLRHSNNKSPSHSILRNMSKGKRVLQNIRRNITPIPMVDLAAESDNYVPDIVWNPLTSVSKDYLDHGDQIMVCQSCNAKLWKSEANRGEKKPNKTNFSLCCAYGKVLLPDLKHPPMILKQLFVSGEAKSNFF